METTMSGNEIYEVVPIELGPEAEAHKRAMPLQRLVGNGMDFADVVELYARVDRGQPWAEAAGVLGDRNSARAEQALTSYFDEASTGSSDLTRTGRTAQR